MSLSPDVNSRPLGFWETVRLWWPIIAFMLTIGGATAWGYFELKAQVKQQVDLFTAHVVQADHRDELLRLDRDKINELNNKLLITDYKITGIEKSIADSFARGEATRARLGTLENDAAGVRPVLDAIRNELSSISRRLDKMEDRNVRIDNPPDPS